MITLTPQAVQKAKEFFTGKDDMAGKAIRVLVQAGSCSSYQYGFAFDVKKDGDTAWEVDGLPMLVDAQSAGLLNGAVIDYKEDFSGGGFAISNPNAKKSCGCGKSFDA
jgi:iron-sulfur cluster assembly accessory protein